MRRVLACQPCICYLLPVNGFHRKPPLCKGRWHFRKKMTEGLLLTSLSSFCSLRSISQSLSLTFARQLPLHKGAFDTIKFCPCFLFAFSSSAEPTLNHATIAWFSLYNKTPDCGESAVRCCFLIIDYLLASSIATATATCH